MAKIGFSITDDRIVLGPRPHDTLANQGSPEPLADPPTRRDAGR